MTTQKSTKLFIIAILLLFSMFLFGFVPQAYQLYRLHKETVKTQARVEQLQQENAQLEQEKINLSDIHYIEKVARDEHNMVAKDEIPLFMLEDKQDKKGAVKK